MVRGIKPRSFKDHLAGRNDFSQCFLAAFRTNLKWGIVKIDDAQIAHHKIHSDRYKSAYVLLAINQQGIIARTGSESKGKPVRGPLTDAANVIHGDLCILTGANNNQSI